MSNLTAVAIQSDPKMSSSDDAGDKDSKGMIQSFKDALANKYVWMVSLVLFLGSLGFKIYMVVAKQTPVFENSAMSWGLNALIVLTLLLSGAGMYLSSGKDGDDKDKDKDDDDKDA